MRTLITAESAPVVERLAREKAWLRFLAEAAWSLQVWRLDADVRSACEPVTDWLRRCRDEIDALVTR